MLEGMFAVPVASDGLYPLNPFTVSWHLEAMKKLVGEMKKLECDSVVHVGFHSYDFLRRGEADRFALKRMQQVGELIRQETEPLLLSEVKEKKIGEYKIEGKKIEVGGMQKLLSRASAVSGGLI